MKCPRRKFLQLAAGAAAIPAISPVSWVQTYPSRPVRLIHGFTPGGGADLVARVMAQWLSERLGQAIIVESKPGAGTNIAVQSVVNSSPDGYTLLIVASTNMVTTSFYEKVPFDVLRDIAPVAGLVRLPLAMAITPSVPARTVSEFIAYAKLNPRKLNMGSSALGGLAHLAGELFKSMADVDMVHVPYRGSAPLMIDLIAGQVHVAFEPLAACLPKIQSGALRALAVTTPTRLDSLPDLPALSETVSGYEAIGWYGIGVPKGTPAQIIETLSREIISGLSNPSLRARFVEAGTSPMPLAPAEFGAHMEAETKKWAKVVKFTGIKAG
jgi:tripartite-type tricarboxylate transporter receptor subunit TctC